MSTTPTYYLAENGDLVRDEQAERKSAQDWLSACIKAYGEGYILLHPATVRVLEYMAEKRKCGTE